MSIDPILGVIDGEQVTMPYIIRRGGYGPKTFWAGFKQNDGNCPPSKPRLKWSKKAADAVMFVHQSDANEVRTGLRMFRLSPSVIKTETDFSRSGVGPDAANPRQSHLQGVTGRRDAHLISEEASSVPSTPRGGEA